MMNSRAFILKLSVLALLLLVCACTTMPTGPRVLVMPGAGKSFDQFKSDDFTCRQFAQDQLGGTTADQAAVDSGVRSATAGTLIGALAGAALNGRGGAGVGAGVGLLFGSMAGTDEAAYAGYALQRRYDIAYQQCMYAQGNQVPAARGATPRAPTDYYPPPNTLPPGAVQR